MSARLFIGVRVAVEAANDIRRAVEDFRRKGSELSELLRYVPPANYHLTLRYLGFADPTVREALDAAVAPAIADVEPFEFRCVGAGAFAKASKGRVAWIGVEQSSGVLAELVTRIDSAVDGLGFAARKKPLSAHVTVARSKTDRDLSKLVQHLAEHAFSRTSVDSVVLFESVITSNGSEYVERARWPLGGGDLAAKRQT